MCIVFGHTAAIGGGESHITALVDTDIGGNTIIGDNVVVLPLVAHASGVNLQSAVRILGHGAYGRDAERHTLVWNDGANEIGSVVMAVARAI